VFKERSRLDSRSFPDGLAETVVLAEKYAACSYWALVSGPQAPRYRVDGESGFQVRPEECDPDLPQSPHGFGINVAMADGSVRAVSKNISRSTWYAAHTPAGGEKLGSGDYADWLP
jgi:prepilin-type processing-associated H-X9-DG protein